MTKSDRVLRFTSRTHIVAGTGLALGLILGAASASAGNWGGLALCVILCIEAYIAWQSDRRFLFSLAELELSRTRVQVEIRSAGIDPSAVAEALKAELDRMVERTAGES